MMTLNSSARLRALGIFVLIIPIAAFFIRPWLPALGRIEENYSGGSSFPASKLSFQRENVGPEFVHHPRITNVQIVDFDQDGINDILVCDAQSNRVLLYRQTSRGDWHEQVLGEDLAAPAHAEVVDLDQDGDNDVVVAILGSLAPNDGKVGQVIWLENEKGKFTRHLLLDDVRRVADVQPGDLDGDGDIDLVVAVFGYAHGQILWLENDGHERFLDHELQTLPGTIHVPLADYDGDGDLDIAAIVSQGDEEVWGFENLGGGEFRARRLFYTTNFDIGSAGLVLTDLDGDGDQDFLLPVGDNLEDMFFYPQPYHGCIWLKNNGNWEFEAKRIATFGGTYAAGTGDFDGDGDRDVVLVSMFNEWDKPGRASIVWLENDGEQNFTTWQISDRPIDLATVACGDLDGDGRDDIVAGGLHLRPPYDRLGRVTSWISGGDQSP